MDLHKSLTAEGWVYLRSAKGHEIYRHPKADELLTISGSPSDFRVAKNVLAMARRLVGDRPVKPLDTAPRKKAKRGREAAIDPRYPNEPTASYRPPSDRKRSTRVATEVPAVRSVPVAIPVARPARDPLEGLHPKIREEVARELARCGLDARHLVIVSPTKVVIDAARVTA